MSISSYRNRVVVTAIAVVVSGVSNLAAQQRSPSPPTDEQIQRMQEIYLPSSPHSNLARLAGEWVQVTEFAGTGGQVVRAHGTVTNRLILGGRFVVSEGSVTQPDGPLASEAMLVFGFDGRTRQYTIVVFDTFGTYFVTAAGQSTDASKRIQMSGETPEGSGQKRFDVVLEWQSQDAYRVQIVFHHPGVQAPTPAVSSTFTRVRVTGGLRE